MQLLGKPAGISAGGVQPGGGGDITLAPNLTALPALAAESVMPLTPPVSEPVLASTAAEMVAAWLLANTTMPVQANMTSVITNPIVRPGILEIEMVRLVIVV